MWQFCGACHGFASNQSRCGTACTGAHMQAAFMLAIWLSRAEATPLRICVFAPIHSCHVVRMGGSAAGSGGAARHPAVHLRMTYGLPPRPALAWPQA